VARAYQELQAENILETVRGTGLAVTDAAAQKCAKERARLIRDRMNNVAGEARQSGLERDDVQKMFQDELGSVFATRGRR
jgi:GntR family transcriptional regulator